MRPKSMHVYCPGRPTLDRLEFVRLMSKRDWDVTCMDPSDRRPRRKGYLMDDLLVGRRPGKPAAYEVLQVSEFPFDVDKVLASSSFEDWSFGKRIGEKGVKILKKAKLLHAFNGRRTVNSESVQFVLDVAQAVAKAEGGRCYDCNAVRFL